jgi:hypothetical protein
MWSTVGSSGTVDLADVGKVVFAGSVVQLPGISKVIKAQREASAGSPAAVGFVTTTARI